ncbi:putative xanthine dehydrogenase accessory factor, putative subfamily [Salinisphaera sp. PC39]|uniref:XdhC family protein n=1 Tax=Salinisphaera sp. PC39 TaxID=1304156 RepID=UPI0033412973
MYGLDSDLLPILEDWHARGHRAALATLVSVCGSSPRPLGSEMAVNDAGEVAGYVSGGCVEASVAAEARQVLANGEPVMLDYGTGSPVLDVRLACGGRIGILVWSPGDLGIYTSALRGARDARHAITRDLDLRDGTYRFAARPSSEPGEHVFRQRHVPPSRLVLVGGDPVTLALCRQAPMLGFEVVLLRPSGPPEPPPGMPVTHYDNRRLDKALNELRIDPYSAVYTLAHDMDDDHAVLTAALASDAFAIGALGSKRKAAERFQRLRAEGFDEDRIERVSSPAGHDIGAQGPQEIALSILAELLESRPRDSARMASAA